MILLDLQVSAAESLDWAEQQQQQQRRLENLQGCAAEGI